MTRRPMPKWSEEVSASEVARALDAGEPVQVVDVRAPFRIAVAGRIDLGPEERFHNIVGSQLLQLATLEGTGIDPTQPSAVVCGHGNDSRVVAAHLRRLGGRASSMAGGMAAWMNVLLPRELEPPAALDRLVQFDRVGKGALGYLLVSDGEAVIVDPTRDPAPYLAAAREAGAEIVAVADTHVHADYISGAPALSRDLGVPYRLHPADAVYPYDGTPGRLDFLPLEDGGTIDFGRCSLRACHTPGHTVGSVTFLVDDEAALTGDFLFVGSVGRPDLAGKTAEWTGHLWDSLERARREWPAGTVIYPAHYGSAAERRPDRSVAGRFGRLLEENAALALPDAESFSEWVGRRAASFPDSYRKIKAVNVGLIEADEGEAELLEIGRNECALGGA
jgi:glyoxylase-like metal-dependent hydrolase (beta-lactamase superfamily II)